MLAGKTQTGSLELVGFWILERRKMRPCGSQASTSQLTRRRPNSWWTSVSFLIGYLAGWCWALQRQHQTQFLAFSEAIAKTLVTQNSTTNGLVLLHRRFKPFFPPC